MNRSYNTSDGMLKLRPAVEDEDIHGKVAWKGQLTLACVEYENIRLLRTVLAKKIVRLGTKTKRSNLYIKVRE